MQRRNTAGLSDAEAAGIRRATDHLDHEATVERNRMLGELASQLKQCTSADIRHVRRRLEDDLHAFRDTWGCFPHQVESVLRYGVIQPAAGGVDCPMILDNGPNPEPLVHALLWLEKIVKPVLIAAQAPDFFYAQYAPQHFDNFDAGDPYLTVRAWGLPATLFHETLAASWNELSDRARRSIREDLLPRVKTDGARSKAEEHIERYLVFEAERERQSRVLRKPRAAARASAMLATRERFAVHAPKCRHTSGFPCEDDCREIGDYALQNSIKIARALLKREATPIDWRDFIL